MPRDRSISRSDESRAGLLPVAAACDALQRIAPDFHEDVCAHCPRCWGEGEACLAEYVQAVVQRARADAMS